MKPVDQQFMNDPEKGIHGDCMKAVFASILEMSIDDVPHFLQEANGETEPFWEGVQKFCASLGYQYLEIESISGLGIPNRCVDVYHVICGKSPRGDFYHAVVGCNGEIVFDPHPSRAGLEEPEGWYYGMLVKV